MTLSAEVYQQIQAAALSLNRAQAEILSIRRAHGVVGGESLMAHLDICECDLEVKP